MPRRPILLGVLLVLLAACGGGGTGDAGSPEVVGRVGTEDADAAGTPEATAAPGATDEPVTEPQQEEPDRSLAGEGAPELRIEDVVTGLVAPWGLAFLPDGTALVTERDSGRLLAIDGDDIRVVRTFDVDATGEGGLLGVAVQPEVADDPYIYVYYTTSRDNRVVRFRQGGELEEIVTGIPAAAIHDGGRIAFGPDGMLYIGTGDATVEQRAQELDSLGGKILRLTPEGEVPADNPFDGSPVWTLGHRNVQGLGWSADGTMYAAEFGPDRDDEINRIAPGENYGWPLVTGRAGDERFADPVLVRQPPDASWSGMAVPTASAVSAWDGDLVAASLRGERLWIVELAADDTVSDAHDLLVGRFGRLRLAAQAPDGSIWLLTSNRDGRGDPQPDDDRVVRITTDGG